MRRPMTEMLRRAGFIDIRALPWLDIAAMVGEHDTRIWRVHHHHVKEARTEADFSGVQRGRYG